MIFYQNTRQANNVKGYFDESDVKRVRVAGVICHAERINAHLQDMDDYNLASNSAFLVLYSLSVNMPLSFSAANFSRAAKISES